MADTPAPIPAKATRTSPSSSPASPTATKAPSAQPAPQQQQQPAGDNIPKVRWDDAGMKTAYANVCNVSSTREEVTLLFGVNQAWQQSQKELVVQLTDRIILSPFAAKRLATLLQTVVKEYESRFGGLDTSAQKTYDMTRHQPPPKG
jgi:hypothetical protein